MKAMKWLFGVMVAAAITVPLYSANAAGGGHYGGSSNEVSHRGHYGKGDYHKGYKSHYRGYKGHYRGHYRGGHRYYGRHGYYRGYPGRYGHGGYGRPWIGYRGPVRVAPPPRW